MQQIRSIEVDTLLTGFGRLRRRRRQNRAAMRVREERDHVIDRQRLLATFVVYGWSVI